jgi:hypothetical protein
MIVTRRRRSTVGINDAAEQLQVAIEECGRLERELEAEKRAAALAEKHWHRDQADLALIVAERDRLERENAGISAELAQAEADVASVCAMRDQRERWEAARTARIKDIQDDRQALTAERDAARANSESMRELARLHTDACFCTYGENGPEQGCPQHGDIAWFAAGLAIVRAERDALAAWKANAQITLDYDKAQMDGLAAVIDGVRQWNMLLNGEPRYRQCDDVLATTPADTLEAVKAEAWDEGVRDANGDLHELVNPHRTTTEPEAPHE